MKPPLQPQRALDFLALGEPLVEFNRASRGDAHTWLQGFGGDTSNAAIAAARLGVRAGYVTRVGADAFGRWFMDLWQREGVDTRGVREDPVAPTGVYFVSHGAGGHEFSYLRAGSAASHLTSDNVPLDTIRDAQILHLSAISQAISPSACDACFTAMDAARDAGVRIAYDTNLRLKLWPLPRARAVIREAAQRADWILPSLDEAELLFGDLAPEAIVDACHVWGAPLVILKLGAAGCIVCDGRRRERIEGCRVDTVDATGAGDCFDGAFAARLIAGDDAFAAARYANAAAALATTGFGAVAPLPDHAAVQRLLAGINALAAR